MARLKAWAWSFAVGYVLPPLAFYTVDALGHLPKLTIAFPILLNVVLAATVLGTVRLIEANSNRLGTEVPLAVGIGAGLGLFHGFPIYLALGAQFIWHSVGPMQGLWYLALLNMVFPVLSLSGARSELTSPSPTDCGRVGVLADPLGARDQERFGGLAKMSRPTPCKP